jgi:hypothetical protein
MSTETKTLADLAGEAYDCFTTTTRSGSDDESIVVLKDERPEWVYELVRSAHGDDFLPDDWRYESIHSALAFIHDNDAGEDASHEFADSNVDVYTAARYQWLASHLAREGYVREARDEGLIGPDADISDQIGVGQYMESQEVFGLVLDALTDALEEADPS